MKKRSASAVACCIVLACSGVLAQDKPAVKSEFRPPTLFVTWERKTIRESDSVSVDIWVQNPSMSELTGLRLHVQGPFDWRLGKCNQPLLKGVADLGRLRSGGALRQSLCVSTGANIKVGDFTAALVLEYDAEVDGVSRTGFVSSETTIAVRLLGTDNIAGVPLSIAAFVAPGLFFWLLLQLFGVPGTDGVPLGDRMIYSIVVSLVIVFGGERLGIVDVGTGIGVPKLLGLSTIGAGLGFVSGSGYLLWCIRNKRKRLESAITTADTDSTSLQKLLEKYKDRTRPVTTVILKTGEEYVGSIGDRQSGFVLLLGWYQFQTADPLDEVGKKLKELVLQRRFKEAFRFANENSVKLQLVDSVKRGPNQTATGEGLKRWNFSEVQDVQIEAEKGKREPVTVA